MKVFVDDKGNYWTGDAEEVNELIQISPTMILITSARISSEGLQEVGIVSAGLTEVGVPISISKLVLNE